VSRKAPPSCFVPLKVILKLEKNGYIWPSKLHESPMDQTEKNIRRLISIRNLAVESESDSLTEKELMELSHEALTLAENSGILDQTKLEVLQQLMNHEIRSFKKLIESDMSNEARVENLIFFCVSVITLIHGKIDI